MREPRFLSQHISQAEIPRNRTARKIRYKIGDINESTRIYKAAKATQTNQPPNMVANTLKDCLTGITSLVHLRLGAKRFINKPKSAIRKTKRRETNIDIIAYPKDTLSTTAAATPRNREGGAVRSKCK